MGAKKILWGVRLNRVSVCFALPRIQNLTFLEAISFHQGVQLLSSTTTSSLITNFTPHNNTLLPLGTIIFDQGVQLVISNCQLLSSTTFHLWLQKFYTTLTLSKKFQHLGGLFEFYSTVNKHYLSNKQRKVKNHQKIIPLDTRRKIFFD